MGPQSREGKDRMTYSSGRKMEWRSREEKDTVDPRE
jgi:hypothetical protein